MKDEVGLDINLPCGKSLAEIIGMPKADPSGTADGQRAVGRPARLLIVGLILGAMAEILLYQNSLGIGFTIFAIFAVAGLIAVGHWEADASIRWRNVTPLTATTLFFAAMIAIRGGGAVTALNIAFCVRLGTLLLGLFTQRDILQIGVGDLIGIPWRVVSKMMSGGSPVVQSLNLPGAGARRRLLLPTARGLLLAVPILVVLIALFSSADAVFAERAGELGRWLFPADYWDRIFRVGFALLVAWASIGGLAYAVAGNANAAPGAKPKAVPGFTEAMTILVLVNAVFLSFIGVQFSWMFGGSNLVKTMPNLTYTQYVHSGFNQLICVGVISLVLISALCAAIDPVAVDRRRHAILNGSGLVLLGLTLVVLLSAAQRMSAYEAAYGATVTRIWVDDFICFLAVALLWRGVTLYSLGSKAPSFGSGVLAAAIGLGVALNLQNPEAAAVQTNLARYQATGKVDNSFFSQSVSVDEVHNMCFAYRTTTGDMHTTIGFKLKQTLDSLETERHSDKWSSWHAGRAAARAELEAIARELPAGDGQGG